MLYMFLKNSITFGNNDADLKAQLFSAINKNNIYNIYISMHALYVFAFNTFSISTIIHVQNKDYIILITKCEFFKV